MRRLAVLCLSFVLPFAGCGRPATSAPPAAPAGEPAAVAMPAPSHPLDPLAEDEIRTAVLLARADSRLASAKFPTITLHEPQKDQVLAWRSGTPLTRQARLQAMTADGVFEAIADVGGNRLISVTHRTEGEPAITLSELEALGIVLENETFKAALGKRGVTDLEKVFCAPFSAGYYGAPSESGQRLVKVGCFDTRRSTTNMFGWPIERLYALVDLRANRVLSVTDDGVVPIADIEMNFDEAASGPLRAARKPTLLTQPSGPNFTVDGHAVTWGKWRFHARVDPRVGTVISLAQWQDGSAARSVLYQGYLSEMFVPYMDPDYGWQTRTYFDTGEYGAGILATPLAVGVDCPATAQFLPATFGNDKGEPFTTPNAICIYERNAGDPIWRHYESMNQTYEGRTNVELVVRMATTIGNYDYLFDWVFNDAGDIEARVGATGIDALKGVQTRRMDEATAAADTRYGTLVAPNLVAVHHDHYFNFRLDLDVDGAENTFNRDAYRAMALPPGSARRSIYVVEQQRAESEKAAQLQTGHGPARLRVMNEGRTNAVGNPVSYELLVANHARLIIDPEDWPAKRARFLQHDVWVTRYAPEERYAAGEYVFGGKGTDGLHVWAARDRGIRKQDIVVWVNLGMHHLTRAEDLPVMPTIWHSFKLRPHNFFARNPAIDLRHDLPSAGSPTQGR
jgi:primary-amine oxidase